MAADITSLSLSDRVVVLCLADLELHESLPTHTGEIVRETRECLETVDADTIGKPSEAEIKRALNRLEADGVVEMVDTGERSPTGKGRPAYALAVGTDTILEALAGDEDVRALAERVVDRTQ